MYIEADLENSPLEIKTDIDFGSDKRVYVSFSTSEKDYAGEVILIFTSPPQYVLLSYSCVTSWTNFPTELPTDTNKVWRITLTKTSGIRLVIHCNEVKVLNVLLSDSTITCSNSKWAQWGNSWSKDIENILFKSGDRAYYRGYIKI